MPVPYCQSVCHIVHLCELIRNKFINPRKKIGFFAFGTCFDYHINVPAKARATIRQ